MKGVIFNLLEQVVTREYGANTWDDLIDEAGVDGAYSSLGNYPDAQVEALVQAASVKTGLSRGQILHWFGVQAMPILRDLYPGLFEPHSASEEFVLSVNENIHPEVRKLYPEANCPFFHIRARAAGHAELTYESDRDLIDLAHGFIDGAAQLYGDTARVTVSDAAEGSKRDRLVIAWQADAA